MYIGSKGNLSYWESEWFPLSEPILELLELFCKMDVVDRVDEVAAASARLCIAKSRGEGGHHLRPADTSEVTCELAVSDPWGRYANIYENFVLVAMQAVLFSLRIW